MPFQLQNSARVVHEAPTKATFAGIPRYVHYYIKLTYLINLKQIKVI